MNEFHAYQRPEQQVIWGFGYRSRPRAKCGYLAGTMPRLRSSGRRSSVFLFESAPSDRDVLNCYLVRIIDAKRRQVRRGGQ